MAINRSALVKEFSKKETDEVVKKLLKERVVLSSKHYKPGNLLFTSYNAKHKDLVYDKTPLALILVRGKKYSLVLNFHWIPLRMRLKLIDIILKMNKYNIANKKPLEFSYGDLKPLLKRLGYAPCIRKYINVRMGRQGVVIPPERLREVAQLRTANFTNGLSAEVIYKQAIKNASMSKRRSKQNKNSRKKFNGKYY